ncbi:hypothetical protein D3C75_136040 [compost metagenome]
MARTIISYPPLYPGSSIDNVFNRNPTTWFRVAALDGTFTLSQSPRPIDGNIGAWLNVIADADGNVPGIYYFQWQEPRTVRAVRAIWDYQSQEYATQYQIILFAADNSTLYNYTISNTFVDGYFTFPTAVLVNQIYVRPLKWSKPNARIKVNHVGIMDRYDNTVGWTNSSLDMQGFSEIVGSVKSAEGSFGEVDTSGESSVPGVGIYPTVGWSSLQFQGETSIDNVYTRYQASHRKVHAKVEITYTDPFSDNTIEIIADTNSSSSTEYLIDGITETSQPYASLTRNDLTGFYKPLPNPVTKVNPPAWWGRKLSDVAGYLNEVITIKFSPRSINSLRLDGDSALNEYPRDFYYVLYSGVTQVYRTDVTNNTQVHWLHEMPDTLLAVDRMELHVTRINRPNAVLKIAEMFTNIVETYYTEDIVTINLLDEIGYASNSVPIGNISANEVDISIDNTNRRFDLNNNRSSLYGFVKRNRKVRVWFGTGIEGEPEWVEMGTFWTTSWDISSDSLVATLTARDRLDVLRHTIFDTSALYAYKSLYELFQIILNDAGLVQDVDYELDNDLSNIAIPYAWFPKQSHREALQHLASCYIIQVFCMRNGMIRVNLDLDATPTPVTTYSDDVDVFNAKYPLAVTEQVNSVTVSYTEYYIGPTEVLYEHTQEVPVTTSVSTDFVFSNVPVYVISDIELTSTNDMVKILSYQYFAWGVRITLVNIAGGTNYVTNMKFRGRRAIASDPQSVLAEDQQLIMDDGRLATSVSHPFLQTSTLATQLANNILTNYKQARYDITMEDLGNGAVRLSDRIYVDNAQRRAEYMVTRMNFSWDGALGASTEGKLLKIIE